MRRESQTFCPSRVPSSTNWKTTVSARDRRPVRKSRTSKLGCCTATWNGLNR